MPEKFTERGRERKYENQHEIVYCEKCGEPLGGQYGKIPIFTDTSNQNWYLEQAKFAHRCPPEKIRRTP